MEDTELRGESEPDLENEREVKWVFRELRPGDPSTDPTESEFFREEGVTDALTRESIQNSLDARLDEDEPVEVRFSVAGTVSALDSDRSSKYMKGLWPHLESTEVDLVNQPEQGEPLSFVVVEDFNTRGLRGDPGQYDDKTEGSENNDFYYFWRNRGRSDKSSTDRGRWGVGKLAFSSASRVNSFWGLTRRADDKRKLLLGLSLLKVHHVDDISDERLAPDGYFGYHQSSGSLALPADGDREALLVQQFEKDFQLQRDESPGLSVVIPYPYAQDLTSDRILCSAIRHYFYPILSKDLVIRVKSEAGVKSVSAETIREVAAGLDWSGSGTSHSRLERLFDFTDWALSCQNDDMTELKTAGTDGIAPSWTDEAFNSRLDELAKLFEDGTRLGLRAPIVVKPSEGDSTTSHFDIFIVRDSDTEGSDEHYIRQGLTIPGISKISRGGIRALLIVEDEVLSSVIGDAENPAHTTWSERADRVGKNYTHGATTVRYVKNALKEAVARLSRPPEGKDTDLLKNIFSIAMDGSGPGTTSSSESGEEENNGNGDESGGESSGGSESESSSSGNSLKVNRIDQGFEIRPTGKGTLPHRARVEVAYDTEGGDAFKNYDSLDFQLTSTQFQFGQRGGVRVDEKSQNAFGFEVESKEFVLSLTGFDPLRDLVISVTETGSFDEQTQEK